MCRQSACTKRCRVTLVKLVWLFSTVYFHMHKRMRNHILCICSTFLCAVFLNACSKRLHKRMQIHIGYTCLTFPYCAYSKNISLICSQKEMYCHIRCICSTFLCCVLIYVCSKRWHKRMQIYIGCICLTLTHCSVRTIKKWPRMTTDPVWNYAQVEVYYCV